MFNKKEYYRNIAYETIDIINKGFYIYSNRDKINIKDEILKSIDDTSLFELHDNIKVDKNYSNKLKNIEILEGSIINELIKIRKRIGDENIVALNFASARNPGGGFLSGSTAQEESIVRASTLYPCLLKEKEFYNYHKNINNPLYSDKMIYSPNVLIIRNDKGELINKPIRCSFITSPAVNAKVAKERGMTKQQIYLTMERRIEKIIYLAMMKKADVLVLGAFGCGVFGNNVDDIAKIFSEKLNNRFEELKNTKIYFVIYDKTHTIIDKFRNTLLNI